MCKEMTPIVCLCGSTKFMDAFHAAGWQLTLRDIVVLSVGVCKHAEDHGGEALGPDVAARLDELHKRKIDLAHLVFVLNVGGYIGDSTRSEIEYAERIGRPVAYLESCDGGRETKDWDELTNAVRSAALGADHEPSLDIGQRARRAAEALYAQWGVGMFAMPSIFRDEAPAIIAAQFSRGTARSLEDTPS